MWRIYMESRELQVNKCLSRMQCHERHDVIKSRFAESANVDRRPEESNRATNSTGARSSGRRKREEIEQFTTFEFV